MIENDMKSLHDSNASPIKFLQNEIWVCAMLAKSTTMILAFQMLLIKYYSCLNQLLCHVWCKSSAIRFGGEIQSISCYDYLPKSVSFI